VVAVGDEVKPILYARGSPIISTLETGRLRAVHLGFDLLDTDLPLRVAFPILMSNILEWLSPRQGAFVSHQVQAGAPYFVDIEGMASEVNVRKPSGEWVKMPVTENPLAIRDTSQVGVYTVRAGKRTQRFAVNLVSQGESDILPKLTVPTTGVAQAASLSTQETVNQPLWPYFVVLAFVLTLLEWYFWCRTGA